MERIHIVGTDYSFTHNACRSRYSEVLSGEHEFKMGYEQTDIVAALLEGKIPDNESAVVPLWNSNVGTVNMDERKKITGDLFLRKGGEICDLWPEEIIFKLTVKDKKNIGDEGDLYSVKVAVNQCSVFLEKIGVLGTPLFIGYGLTTVAAEEFLAKGQLGDGLLCSEELLEAKELKSSDENMANPNNFTIFSTFNKLPVSGRRRRSMSLCCILVDLDGNDLPSEFYDYYNDMLSMPEIKEAEDICSAMPKILFVLRYEESKALMLLEMDSGELKESPWGIPDIESGLDFRDEVGRIQESFAASVSQLFESNFKSGGDFVFYGFGNSFVWVCPALNIAVHGYDKELVRTCAKAQVLHLKHLIDSGIEMSKAAVTELQRFAKDPASLKLAADSEPDGP